MKSSFSSVCLNFEQMKKYFDFQHETKMSPTVPSSLCTSSKKKLQKTVSSHNYFCRGNNGSFTDASVSIMTTMDSILQEPANTRIQTDCSIYCQLNKAVRAKTVHKSNQNVFPDFGKSPFYLSSKTLCTYLLHMNALSVRDIFYAVFIVFFLTHTITTSAYVLTEEGETQTFLHRRLAGRQRREVQKEILSILGLNHRPHPNAPNPIEKSSAPLYMLGLYRTASNNYYRDQIPGGTNVRRDTSLAEAARSSPRQETRTRSHSRRMMPRSSGPFALDSSDDVFPTGISPDLSRYIEDSGILTHEVGILTPNLGPTMSPADFVYEAVGSVTSNEIDQQLMDSSDLAMSFVNTKQPRGAGADESFSISADFTTMLRRHRSYYFDINLASADDHLTASKFRLYKEISDGSIGNQTLRVNVYQAVSQPDRSIGAYLLGSRLVGSNQEGWLVYDVTNALLNWLQYPESNLGLKVTVETMEGRNLKLTKTGVVGRRGELSKQAFIVAFFTQSEGSHLQGYSRSKRRRRRSPDAHMDADQPAENGIDEEGGQNDVENSTKQTNIFHEEEDSHEYDGTEDNHPTTTNEVSRDESQTTSRNNPNKRIPRRERPRKKGRRKNKKLKNSSKRKHASEHCQRKPLYVNFRDLNWHNWIIAPPGYPAYQCMGKCSFPLNANMNATNHAIVQSLVHLMLPQMNIPEPCCTPTNLEPISVLYYNDKTNVVYKKYQNMIVSSCGCH